MPRITITAPDQNSQPYRFQLDREVVSLGRGSENDIVIDSGSVSTHHAEMRRVIGGYEIHDLGSTNGTKLEGVRYPVVPLVHGSVVHLGDVGFEISLTDEEQAMLIEEAPAAAGYSGYVAPVGEVPRATQPIGQVHTPTPRPVPQRQVIVMQQEESGGFMMGLVMVILAVVAFGAGASIRHQKETGKQLIESIKAKQSNQAKPASPSSDAAPATPQAPVPPPIAPVMPAAPPLPSSGGAKPDLPAPQ